MPPRRHKPKDTPGKLATRMKRRFRIVLMRKSGEVLGTVEAADPHAASKHFDRGRGPDISLSWL
jgi:hypothetical protein